jgi:murein L,D-transpeptidase YafK
MTRINGMRIFAVLLTVGAVTFLGMKISEARNPSGEGDRVAAARPRAEPALRTAFANAGVAYPAVILHFRAFKREGELELWAADKAGLLKKVATYPVLARSGMPGPKRKEGDYQVPEGFYKIDRFNPKSLFHLSLGLDYPNAADRILGDRERPGSDIFVHGKEASIGCLPMGDEMIEQIYIAALETKSKPVTVHIFPARMSGEDWPKWREEQVAKKPALDAFWKQLQPAYDQFEKSRTLPQISVSADGAYRVQ